MDNIQSMIYQSRDGVFSAWFEVKETVKELDLIKVFVLINKYYPSCHFKSDDFIEKSKRWEDYLLSDFQHRPFSFNNIYLTSEFYVQDQEGKILMLEPEDNGIEIIYGSDEGTPVFGIQFYPYVFFDKNKAYFRNEDTGALRSKVVDQSVAAKKNRTILTFFLKELEELLHAEISFFQGGKKYSSDYVYKYGFRENAVLDDLSS